MVLIASEWAGRPLLAGHDGALPFTRDRRSSRSAGRGKSGLPRTRWSVTPTGRKARESATESKPPRLAEPPSFLPPR